MYVIKICTEDTGDGAERALKQVCCVVLWNIYVHKGCELFNKCS
jgi:hypothetical protein